jgi:hypothetical protein
MLESPGKCPNNTHQLIGEKAELSSGYLQNLAISIYFLSSASFLFTFIKSQRSCGKLKKKKKLSGSSPILLLFPTVLILVKLKVVRKSL